MKRQKGFGIPELLIGIAVGMIIVAAAMSLLQVTLRNSNDNIKMARLEQDLRQTMQMLSRDLRRATTWDAAVDVAKVAYAAPLTLSGTTGSVTVTSTTSGALASIGSKAEGGTLVYKYYDASIDTDSDGVADGDYVTVRGTIGSYSSGAYTVTLSGTWPAAAATTDGVSKGSWNILRPESTLTVSGDCVLFIYDFDADDDGDYDIGRYGYRYDSTEKAVEIRTSGANTDTCSSGGTWENLTDPNVVQVTDLSVDDISPAGITSSGVTVSIREYTISVTGNLKSDTAVSRTFQETIRVRNDRVS